MSRYIWLVRHGESLGNLERHIQGTPLSLVRVRATSFRVLLLNDTSHLRCTQEGRGK
jgi:broad specificity phosphatase PhoE